MCSTRQRRPRAPLPQLALLRPTLRIGESAGSFSQQAAGFIELWSLRRDGGHGRNRGKGPHSTRGLPCGWLSGGAQAVVKPKIARPGEDRAPRRRVRGRPGVVAQGVSRRSLPSPSVAILSPNLREADPASESVPRSWSRLSFAHLHVPPIIRSSTGLPDRCACRARGLARHRSRPDRPRLDDGRSSTQGARALHQPILGSMLFRR